MRNRMVLAAAAAALIGVGCVSTVAKAHGDRTVGDGRFEMVVGFVNEPVFAGDKSGLDLRVSYAPQGLATPAEGGHEGGAPVEGLEDTLTAEVRYGDSTMTLPLQAAWDEPGAYRSYFFPGVPEDYTFHITGTIDGVAIDESFTSTKDGFGAVRDPQPVTFPDPAVASVDEAGMFGALGGAPGVTLGALAGVAGAALARRRR